MWGHRSTISINPQSVWVAEYTDYIFVFVLDTINKIWLSALNASSKSTTKLHSSFICFISLLLNLYSSSSSFCRATSTDITDPVLPLLPIVHRFWQVLRVTSRILTELLYVGSNGSDLPCSTLHFSIRNLNFRISS